eukprot:jgi/Hompol1/5579/HPOL_004553-RA
MTTANELPGRSAQLSQLRCIFGESSDTVPPAVFINGHPATGKTTVLRHLLGATQGIQAARVAWINCVETFTQRLLFEQILNQLAGVMPLATNGYAVHARCEYADEFVDGLRQLCNDQDRTFGQRVSRFVVLDKVEALRNIGSATLLTMLLKLAELTHLNICVIMETLAIIAKDCPKDEDPDFFLAFVEVLYTVFQLPCRNLNELRHMVAMLFPKYVQPVHEGKFTRNQTAKLFGHVSKHIQEALHSLYLRNLSSSEWERQISDSSSVAAVPTSSKLLYKALDLPFYTKFLLIASFLASYNPPRLDVRFFTKGREDRKRVNKKSGVENASKLLGPKPFAVERMLAIFYNIVDDEVDLGFNVHHQIATLVSLRLLIRISSMDNLDAARCKCNASYEFVAAVGASVRFDLSKYLFDFVHI